MGRSTTRFGWAAVIGWDNGWAVLVSPFVVERLKAAGQRIDRVGRLWLTGYTPDRKEAEATAATIEKGKNQ